jgi:hypothetical protein
MHNLATGGNKVHLDMERLDVGKTPEEAGHFLDFIADSESHLQSQDLDTRDNSAGALLSSSLRAPKEKRPIKIHIGILYIVN